MGQFEVLAVLKKTKKPMSTQELCKKTGAGQGSVWQSCRRLKKYGLIEYEDRRIKNNNHSHVRRYYCIPKSMPERPASQTKHEGPN